jgi:transketolase
MDKANELRKQILEVATKHKQGHIAPSLSCLDILTVLYYQIASERDTIILSKGHGCYGLYAIWADLGLLPKEKWQNFELPGCVDGYGSLGHGLPVAVGVAYANKQIGNDKHTWVIVGDGEMQEGSCWEALSFMFHHTLTNITVIVDCNRLQAMDRINDILFQSLPRRLQGWGFMPYTCDAHDHEDLVLWLEAKPMVLLAKSVKGNGVDYMENKAEWHYRWPDGSEPEHDNR